MESQDKGAKSKIDLVLSSVDNEKVVSDIAILQKRCERSAYIVVMITHFATEQRNYVIEDVAF